MSGRGVDSNRATTGIPNKEKLKVTSRSHRLTHRAIVAVVALVTVALGLTPAIAQAAPTLGLNLVRKTAAVNHGDEYLEYSLEVKNTSPGTTPITSGTVLRCSPEQWFNQPSFTYQWFRDGVSLGSSNGASTLSYTVQAADEGRSLQCIVKGTNQEGSTVAITPPFVVPPVPSDAPPAPTDPTVAVTARATISTVESTKRLCTPPSDWSGSPTWGSYQWLRDGVEIPGATGEKYEPDEEGLDKETMLQCEVLGTNASGTAIALSQVEPIGTAGGLFPGNYFDDPPIVAGPDYATGPLTVEIEGPEGGEETTILDPKSFPIPAGQGTWGAGWEECEIERATPSNPSVALCDTAEPTVYVAPGDVYVHENPRKLKIVILLGDDTPDEITTTVRASGWDLPTETVAQDTLTVGPLTPFGLMPGVFSTKVTDQANVEYTQAGGHPTIAAEKFEFNWHYDTKHNIAVTDHVRNANTQTPRGFVGSATATPVLCPTVEEVLQNTCPLESMVGGIDIYKGYDEEDAADPFPSNPYYGKLPIYALEPEYGEPAQFAFGVGTVNAIYVFAPELRAQEGYALSLNPSPIVKYPELLGARPTLCSFGAKRVGVGPVITNEFGAHFDGCKAPDDPDANPVPLITNPTRCSGPPPTTKLVVASWEHPNDITSDTYSSPPVTGCDEVQFEPEVSVTPTSSKADSPTGIDAEITMPTDGLEDPDGVSQANLDTATVTLPKGMAVNPAVADGLGACTEAEVKMKSNAEATCPDSSKIGTIDIETPLIRRKLTGDIYVAKQNENPFDSLLGLYMVFSSKRDGLTIKIAGKVVPDPVTGQLTTVFTENPEAPFSRLVLHVKSGNRAPLINPPSCGSYAVHAELSPWSAVNPANPTPEEIVSSDSNYEVTQGPNGAPCPSGALEPKLQAGLKGTQAGAKSPFVFSLSREDGTQRLTGIDLTLPQGLTAYLKGIPYCSDAALGSISETEGTGTAQIVNPSCSAASQVGTSQAGAGAGPNPFYVNTGKAYLAGPYKGAPLSIAVVTPAVAGPFDLGNVLVRTPLYVNRDTAQVTAKSDPIPTILHGLLLDVRDVRVSLDRPGFTAAPTSCEPKSIEATVRGESGATAKLSNRFQVGGCENLGFKPKLAFRLFGGTHRGSHPRLRATLTMPQGGANIASASVALPHSEFLDQAHIKTVCTRVQFAANQCPAGSVYGEAEATSPLVDYTLHGPVYLRSSSNQLPNMVAVLKGPDSQPIEVDLDGRIDSVHGGIRSSFDLVPDQPVSSFTLNMKGGKKGLLVNSRNICKGTPKATAVFTAQNGKSVTLRPPMKSACKKAARKGGKKSKGAKKRRSAR